MTDQVNGELLPNVEGTDGWHQYTLRAVRSDFNPRIQRECLVLELNTASGPRVYRVLGPRHSQDVLNAALYDRAVLAAEAAGIGGTVGICFRGGFAGAIRAEAGSSVAVGGGGEL